MAFVLRTSKGDSPCKEFAGLAGLLTDLVGLQYVTCGSCSSAGLRRLLALGVPRRLYSGHRFDPARKFAQSEGGLMKPIKGAWLLLCLAFATGVVRAQGVGASGDITGTVNDPSGAGIPKATILAVESDKSIQHSTETDTGGEYRLAGLPPATYDVTVKIPG